MHKLFKKKVAYVDPVEEKFDIIMNLIKDLSKADLNRLKKAIDLNYEGYQLVRNVKTADERESEDIINAEIALAKEVNDES